MRPISDKLIFDRIHADRERVIRYMIYGLFVIAVLPVIIFRDFTPENELRYLCIADESLANGNFFAFTNNGVPYADKPPLYLWLVMLCRLVCGSHQMWLLSLLSLIPAFISVGVMNSMSGKELSQRGLTVASSMLLTTAYFLAMSVTLRMDMLMTMFILLAIRSYVRIHESQGNAGKERLLFPLWIFLAVFSKGPIGILVPLVTTLTFGLLEKDTRKGMGIHHLGTTHLILCHLVSCRICRWWQGVSRQPPVSPDNGEGRQLLPSLAPRVVVLRGDMVCCRAMVILRHLHGHTRPPQFQGAT